MDWKKRIKATPFFGVVMKWRGWEQDFKIKREQRDYEARALALGLASGEVNAAEVFQKLKNKLAQRRITWPPYDKQRPLHILYLSLPNVWEAHNIPPQLQKMGNVSAYYLTERGIVKNGNIIAEKDWPKIREKVAIDLPLFVKELNQTMPIDFILSYFSGAHIYPKTIEQIKKMGVPIFSFHWDDRLYFKGKMVDGQYCGPAALCRAYDLNLSNALSSLVKYRVEGGEAIFWPEGANPDFFKPLDQPFKYDISFIGVRYGQRPRLIDYLRKNGINVTCFGKGWENEFIAAEEMTKVYAQSRVNLGFGYVGYSQNQCLKGRDFEVPSCGAVYLTSNNENISRVYRIGEEVIVYNNAADCLGKIRFLLANPQKCEQIRLAARQAVLTRHSWVCRIQQLLEETGVPKV